MNFLFLDIDFYAEKYGEKAVRKNLTIPAWLNTFVEKNNINYSKVLQEALLTIAKTKKILSINVRKTMQISSFVYFLLFVYFILIIQFNY